jgi:hypothetical protein
MKENDVTPPHGSPPASGDAGEEHQREVQSLERAVFHETTQHAPKHQPQKVQAVPPTARSRQRRFPR